MAYRFVRIDREDKLTIITVDRPEVLNALHPPAHHELAEVFNRRTESVRRKAATAMARPLMSASPLCD
jgi:enoyl-CoA hydratase/carnithine racemase